MNRPTFFVSLLLALTAGSVFGRAAQDQSQGDQAQTATAQGQKETQQPWLVEVGGFRSFLNNNYSAWTGVQAKVMYRSRLFSPIFGFAHQKRDYGYQDTIGVDSYIHVNRWFYAIAGGGKSLGGTAELFPRWRYGATGLFSIPKPKGLVATLGYSEIHGEPGTYGRVVSAGAMYYRGRAIVSGQISFNRTHPGAVDSKSGGMAVQYGAEKKYWIAVGFNGGRIAYELLTITPLPVEWMSFGPNVFYQKWLTDRMGIILRYDYQDQVHAFQRHGVSGSVFFEIR